MMSYFEEKLVNEPDEPQLDMWLVDQALAMTQGYVLDFNDARFNDFVRRKFGIDATAPIYTVDGNSKANRFQAHQPGTWSRSPGSGCPRRWHRANHSQDLCAGHLRVFLNAHR